MRHLGLEERNNYCVELSYRYLPGLSRPVTNLGTLSITHSPLLLNSDRETKRPVLNTKSIPDFMSYMQIADWTKPFSDSLATTASAAVRKISLRGVVPTWVCCSNCKSVQLDRFYLCMNSA